jgi:hypothetical protein
MFDKFSRSWSLVKASAAVIRSDKELLLFPVFSGVATLLVIATFAIPLFALNLFDGNGINVLGAIVGFLFYLCQYFVIFFFNSALVGAATIRLKGGDPTVAEGLRIAFSRVGSILGYAAIAATVGLILQALKNKDNNFLVRMIGSGLGVAWTLSTFLVVPVLVNEQVGPIDAIKQSVALLKRTWGENAIGNIGLGTAFGLLMIGLVLVVVALTVLAFFASTALGFAVLALGVLAIALLAIVQAALSGIYSAALYRYAVDGQAPQGFADGSMQQAFAAR